jgi:non-heme chloroperoxidase
MITCQFFQPVMRNERSNRARPGVCPHNWDRLPDSDRKTALIADDRARCNRWAENFRQGVPTARIVLIPNADHYVYLTNDAQVVAEMTAFLAKLQ